MGISNEKLAEYAAAEAREAEISASEDEWNEGEEGLEESPSDRLSCLVASSEPAHASFRQQATIQEIDDAFFEASYDTKVDIRNGRLYAGRF